MPVILGGNTGIYLASLAPAFDPDAQAFITAAAITDPTQQAAINTLVVDLKGYNVWSKMKAIYPFVGGTATTHKFNLKDPRDLDAAFRILWNGGITHSNNGVQFGGVNGSADTKLNANILTQNSTHLSIYSRSNTNKNYILDMAASGSLYLSTYYGSGVPGALININVAGYNGPASNANSLGFYTASRTTSILTKQFRNNSVLRTDTRTSTAIISGSVKIGSNETGTSDFSDRQYAFSSIGDGLTDTEAANFYTAVQAFQTTLGRSIGTQTVSDADAQAFVTAADIQDQVEANAINNLVIGMKADGTWSKMKAVYPFVGSTAAQQKYNLKDPRDLDAAFRLVFSGGITHSANGALFNGINGFADTKLASSGNLTQNSTHFSAYSRTNNTSGGYIMANGNAGASGECKIFTRWFDNNCYSGVNTFGQNPTANADSRGYFIANRIASNVHSIVIGGTKIDFSTTSSGLNTNTFRICSAIGVAFDNKEIAFSSIGDGLTPTELTNLNTRVTTFQTALNRNI